MIVERMLPLACQKLVTIDDNAPLLEAARCLNHKDANLVVVCRPDRKIAGVIAKTDIVREISRCQGNRCIVPAATAMTKDLVLCRRGDLLTDVWAAMKSHGVKHVPVVDEDGRPIALLIARDVLACYSRNPRTSSNCWSIT